MSDYNYDADLRAAQTEALLRSQGSPPLFPRNLTDPSTINDFFIHGKADMVKVVAAAPVGASTTADVLDIVPPDDAEEWELIRLIAVETAAIDFADVVMFFAQHFNSQGVVDIEMPLITGTTASTAIPSTIAFGNVYSFPNANTSYNHEPPGIRLRRYTKDKIESQIHLRVKTSVTVGARNFDARMVFSRRRFRQ